ncbi:MAG: lipocalin-like domain-containing protein [Reyranellaceae bacterium]
MSARDFVGSYRLESFELAFDDGTVEHPLGRDAEGLIVYTREGFFTGQMMQRGRPRFAQARQSAAQKDFGSDREVRDAFNGYVAYWCTFDVDEANSIVNHRIVGALLPNWEGQVNVRHYRFEGDLLVLKSPAMTVGGRPGRSVLHWRRCPAVY